MKNLFIYLTDDTSDDILAKYRGQRNDIDMENKSKANIVESGVTEKPVIVEKGYDLFEDARKKLRLALSTTEVQQLPESLPMVCIFNLKLIIFQ